MPLRSTKPGHGAAFSRADRRAEVEDAFFADPLQLCERRDLRVEQFELRQLVLAGVDQHRHAVAERDVAESVWRLFEEGPAGEGQRADQRIAERIVKHRRASAGRVIADRLLGLEDGHLRMAARARLPRTVPRFRRRLR